jgi:O-antigen/teichoic acid export membrane protein
MLPTNTTDLPRAFPEAASPAGPAAALRPAPSLRRNFAWTLAGNVVYAGCQWGMLVVLAKLGRQEGLGQFSLGLAVTAPVLMLTNLNIRGVQATDARHEYAFGDYLGLRLVATAVALLVITTISFLAGYDPMTQLVILAVGLAKAIESVSDVFYGLLQQHERMARIAVSMMIKGPLALAVLGGLVGLTGNVLWGALGLAATWALVLALYDVPSGAGVLGGAAPWRALRPRWAPATLGRLTYLALPLGVVMFLISLNTNIPRYFVENHLGLRELGVFAALWYLTMAGGMVELAIGHAAHARLARLWAVGDRGGFRSLLLRQLGAAGLLGAAAAGIAAVLGRPLLWLLYGPEYADHAALLTWILAGAAVGYVASQLNFGMTAARRFFVQAPLFLAVNAVTLAACAVFIPAFGLYGAAFAMAASSCFQLAAAGLVMAYILNRGSRP